MSVADALKLPVLLAYERDGAPLEKRNGAPLRLIVPGWYGVACVKWLTRIEVRDRRYMGRFMGRDYVTVRGERRGGEIVYVETSVARMNLKSVVARVTRRPTRQGSIPLKSVRRRVGRRHGNQAGGGAGGWRGMAACRARQETARQILLGFLLARPRRGEAGKAYDCLACH